MTLMVNPEPINRYAELYSSPESAVLHELSEETKANVPGAQMLTGHLAGTFLQLISKMIHPSLILEIGTYTGYSAICLALGLRENGVLHTIDIDGRWQDIRAKYWQKSGLQDRIIQHTGNAADIIDQLNIRPELVFIDADKKGYPLYFEKSLQLLPSGGHIIVDNVLFKGDVLLPEEDMPETALHIHRFNQQAVKDQRVELVMLPVRDGMTLIRKK